MTTIKTKIGTHETDSKHFYKGNEVEFMDVSETTATKEFCYVRLRNGKSGWVPYHKVEEVKE